jgi:hypothetical protein
MKKFILLFKITIVSIIVFFSISFISILYQILPFKYHNEFEQYQLEIGFPFIYYSQFFLKGNEFPNSYWNAYNLLLDCVITWVLTIFIYFVYKKG